MNILFVTFGKPFELWRLRAVAPNCQYTNMPLSITRLVLKHGNFTSTRSLNHFKIYKKKQIKTMKIIIKKKKMDKTFYSNPSTNENLLNRASELCVTHGSYQELYGRYKEIKYTRRSI